MTLDDFLNHIEAGGALNTFLIYRLMDEISREVAGGGAGGATKPGASPAI